MNKDKQRAIARMGGKTAQEKGTAHRYTSESAKEAGRKGGSAPRTRQIPLPLEPDAKEADRQFGQPHYGHGRDGD